MHPYSVQVCTRRIMETTYSTIRRTARIVALMIVAWALSGCAELIPPLGTPAEDTEESKLDQAGRYLRSGEPEQAASLLAQAAKTKPSPQRETLLLQAAETVLQPETRNLARKYLSAIDEAVLPRNLFVRKRIASAELELLNQRVEHALDILPANILDYSPEYKPKALAVRARALRAAGHREEMVKTLVMLSPWLTDDRQKQENSHSVWEILMGSDPGEITAWANRNHDCDMDAWLSLAYIQKQSHTDTFTLENEIQQWRTQFPRHTIPAGIIDSITQNWATAQVAPDRIALLLPMTGRYSAIANAVYAGVITAREFEEAPGLPPELVLYDTGDDADIAFRQYQLAVREGADFVIGPLQKEAVRAIAEQRQLEVPTLSLNYTSDALAGSPQLVQFGLLPENEAQQVAERAFHNNLQKALVLAPEGEWGTRLLDAFMVRFIELGGTVLQYERYIAKNSDYSGPIKKLLHLDQSEQRHRNIEQTIGQEAEFEPRRRQDADFVFLAALPRQARLLRPQLSYHYASDLPVYATSHVFSGNENISADQDINDVLYCDIPWLLSDSPEVELLQDSSDLQMASSESRLPRFAALGVDAYRVIPHLQRLAAHKYNQFEGMTGKLSIGEQNRIFRKLTWAQFRNGRPEVQERPTLDFPRSFSTIAAGTENPKARQQACQ